MQARVGRFFPAIFIMLAVAAGIGFWVGPGLAQETSERILFYGSHVVVHPDAGMTVTETIRVNSEQQSIKRGIYRSFPTKYKDRFGGTVRVRFDVVEVLRDGRPEPYHLRDDSNGVRVYIGQEDVFLDRGVYTYTLKYRTDRQLGFFKDFDELYWNVTGNDWEFPIDKAEAVIELPPGAEPIGFTAYTGPIGAKGDDFTASRDERGRIVFATTRMFNPGEGITVAVSWPKGFVREPTAKEKIGYLLSDNPSSVAGLAWLAIIFGYYFVVWARVGKDPAAGTIIPLFNPPDGFSPAAIRYIRQMNFDHKTFAAAVVSLAVKGKLSIEDDDGDFVLHKEGGPDSSLSTGEKKVLTKLFTGSDTIELDQVNHSRIGRALKALKTALKTEYEKVHFVTNSKLLIPGILLTVLGLISIIFTASEPVLAGFMSLWLSLWSVGVSFLGLMVYRLWRGVFSGSGSKKAALGMTAFALPFLGGEIGGLVVFTMATSILALLSFLGFILVNFLFYQWLKAPTMEGRRVLDLIDGFSQYLSVAEKERLDMLNPPEKTPALFEKYLPYAMALNVENEWCAQFADVLNQAGMGGEYSPPWYTGRTWSTLGPAGFASSLGVGFAGAISSSSTAPGSSSGSSGGGFSGGGGGGGGGGGW